MDVTAKFYGLSFFSYFYFAVDVETDVAVTKELP